jgi:hypothetical protein
VLRASGYWRTGVRLLVRKQTDELEAVHVLDELRLESQPAVALVGE